MTRDELAALRDAIDTVLTWPHSVRAEIARWLAPPATKPGNGLDPHPPPVASTEPIPTVGRGSPPKPPAAYAGKTRRAKPTPAQAAEQRLLRRCRQNPGLSVNALANAANASRSATGERLRRLSEAGLVEKDGAGRWRLKAEGVAARPIGGVADLTAAPEANCSEPGPPAAAHPRWLKPLSCYERRGDSRVPDVALRLIILAACQL